MQRSRKQNVSNREDFKQYKRLSLCDCGNAQTSNSVYTKKDEDGPHRTTNSTNGTARYSLTLKKYKIAFKIREYCLRIIFFLMAIKDFCFKKWKTTG